MPLLLRTRTAVANHHRHNHLSSLSHRHRRHRQAVRCIVPSSERRYLYLDTCDWLMLAMRQRASDDAPCPSLPVICDARARRVKVVISILMVEGAYTHQGPGEYRDQGDERGGRIGAPPRECPLPTPSLPQITSPSTSYGAGGQLTREDLSQPLYIYFPIYIPVCLYTYSIYSTYGTCTV